MAFECKRCGKCCSELVNEDIWDLGKTLTEEEKQYLLTEIENKPKHDKGGCKMLWFNGKTAHCLVQDIYGYDKKEKVCQKYTCEKVN